MIKAHEIIKQILEKFPGLPKKLERLFSKKEVWWYSHGYELRRDNPLSNGNLSPLDHWFEFVEQYEAAFPGAGKLLNERAYGELKFRFTDHDIHNVAQNNLRRELLKEATEAVCAMDEKCITEASTAELQRWDNEVAELIDKGGDVRAFIRARLLRKKAESNQLQIVR